MKNLKSKFAAGLTALLMLSSTSVVSVFTGPMQTISAASEGGVLLSDNPGFETGDSTGYSTWGTVQLNSTNAYKGSNAAKIGSYSGVYQVVEGLSPNTTYSVSVYGKKSSTATSDGGLYVKNYDATTGKTAAFTTTSYTNYSLTFTTASDKTSAEIGVWSNNAAGGPDLYADELTLVLTATNLLQNAGFESGDTSWTASQNAGYEANNANSGTNSMRVGEGTGLRYQTITSGFTAGKTYTLSGWGKVSKQGTIGYLKVGAYDSANTKLTETMVPFYNWKNYAQNSGTIIVPTGTSYLKVQIGNNNVGYGYAYFDDLILKENTGPTYYVDPAGDDNNNTGTSASSAWKTIGKINNTTFAPGSTILFKGGQIFSGNVTFTNSDFGTIANPITIASYGTGKATISAGTGTAISLADTYGYAITNLKLDGTNRSTNTGYGIYVNNNSIAKKLKLLYVGDNVITNFRTGVMNRTLLDTSTYHRKLEAVNFVGNDVHTVYDYAITSQELTSTGADRGSDGFAIGTNGDTVSNLYAGYNTMYDSIKPTDSSCWGLFYGGKAQMLMVENNTAYNGGAKEGLWNWGGIYSVYQFNTVHDITTSGADGDGINPGASSEVLVQYNYIYNTDGAGILLDEGYGENFTAQNTVIRYNIIHDTYKKWTSSLNEWGELYGGIAINGKGNNHTIYNNTISTSNGSAAITIQGAHNNWQPNSTDILGTNNFKVYNNILNASNGSILIATSVCGTCTGQIKGNLYYTNGGVFKMINRYGSGTTYTSMSSWRSALGYETENSADTSVIGNPALVNPTVGGNPNNFKIGSTSAAKDTGRNLSSLYGLDVGKIDYFQNSTPYNTNYDIGAHEFR
ncbi:carbohydrate binding domain-containing protein [Paenibacillus roseipurpureus]|uniref:Carbohydrate binding domain-containing protein n=1 Tax=Paenibacillus roseopurpureus TaxID=2918901 RepID=A0AA96RL90_9BACL|nr:carbohydrate binding domain-containing protein [Paenibacillus sp. MBLB1832]WNR42892.1 carbohydrate binding domain-containing protein [Paenibacillus sp. MBLB1832]